jgi:phage FluMu gp28-like protein
VLIGSPGVRQSAEVLTKVRRAYQRLGSPLGYEGDSQTRLEFGNRSRVLALPSDGDKIRGYSGPDCVLLDEASRIEDFVIDAITPMLASNRDCKLILMSTPAGARGFWFELWEHGGEAWERYRVTADAIPYISQAHLDEERERMTEAVFLEEYYCEPYASSAAVFSRDTIQRAIRPEFNTWSLD